MEELKGHRRTGEPGDPYRRGEGTRNLEVVKGQSIPTVKVYSHDSNYKNIS